jgi:hypothetical protein
MQSKTTSKGVEKPVRDKVEVKKEISKDKPVKGEIIKEHIIKEPKCSLISGDVNYII